MKIYFSGIGGVGIGPLAEIAVDAGYDASGSDMSASLMTKKLQARGVAIGLSQDGSFLQSQHEAGAVDLLVYTASLPPSHPELALARELDIPCVKRDEFLTTLIHDKQLKLIAIAGTHGKTTTTGMLVWTMKQLGIPLSYSIGTTVSFGPSGKYDPASEYFVYECDEFDHNFLHFEPYLSLITTIDYDHPDSYPTEQNYLDAFEEFGEKSQQIITWNDQHSELFNAHPDAWILRESAFVSMAGEHNRRNATLVLKAIEKLNINGDRLAAINTFPGTDRRFEKLADNLYSDYGHHPVEIAATLQMAHEISDEVVLVYQPHQNVRQHEIRDQYLDCFELAKHIYWLPTYLSREDPELSILGPQELTSDVTNRNMITYSELDDELWDVIQQHRDAGRLVLCMGAGSIDGWLRQKLTRTNDYRHYR